MEKWTTAWTMAHTGAAAFALKIENKTTNVEIHCPISGTKMRIALGNRYGIAPVHISKAVLCVNGKVQQITFEGSPSVSVDYTQNIRSDEVNLSVCAGDKVEVRFFYSQPQVLSSGNVLVHAQHSSDGDHTCDIPFRKSEESVWLSESRPYPLPEPVTVLTALDVYAEDANAIAVLGDSNTLNNYFTSALQRFSEMSQTAVLNLGISGNRLLRDSGVAALANLFGKSAKERVEWDVFLHQGVDSILICVGGNDIFQPGTFAAPLGELCTADELWETTEELALRCRERGLRVFGSTLIPFAGADGYTAQKQCVANAFNEKIRCSNVFDAVIDFATLLADPNNPDAYLPEYDSGDHVHFNALAGECIAKQIKDVYLGH